MINLIFASLIIMLASLVGVVSVWKSLGAWIERNLSYLVSFSAGVFLVVAYSLGIEAVELSTSVSIGLLWIFLGAVGIWLVFHFVPDFHHHHEDGMGSDHTHSKIDARRILAGDIIHNLGDGVLLATSFMISPQLGWTAAAAIFIHELVQEISEFFVLKQAGFETKKALWLNFLASTSLLVGAVLTYLLIGTFELLEPILLGLSAGAFLLVVLNDLIPESVKNSQKQKSPFPYLITFVLGIILMIGVNSLTSSGHSHEDIDHHNDHSGHEHK